MIILILLQLREENFIHLILNSALSYLYNAEVIKDIRQFYAGGWKFIMSQKIERHHIELFL